MADLKGRRVLIGTPTLDGNVRCEFAHSLADTVRLCITEGVIAQELFITGSILQSARNDIVRTALEREYDDLIFIDSDQDWQPEWILRLLSYDVDVVGAPVRKREELEQYNAKTRTGELYKHPEYDLWTARDMTLGTGLIRFSRTALELLWHSSEKYFQNGQERAWIFDIRPIHGELVGEDVIACERLRGLAGISTWIDPSMNPGHYGTKRWEGNFSEWVKKKAAEHVNAGNT